MFTLLLLFSVVGAISGLVAGLFGLGGGVVIVPALLYTFAQMAFPESVATHMAIGTSLGCIVVTATVASRTHLQKGAVNIPLLKTLVPGVIVGGGLGGVFAAGLSGATLRLIFGAFLLFAAASMFLTSHKKLFNLPGPSGLSTVAVVIGFASSLFGVAGGSMTVPYLRAGGIVMANAVATSAVLGLPIAISSVLTYIYQGWHVSALPDYSMGYFYWPAFIGIVVCSAPTARLGARLAHRLPAEKLQRAFAVVIIMIAAQIFIGRFLS